MLSFLFIIVVFICLFVLCVWVMVAVKLDDYTVPLLSKVPCKNVLVVFPHPDDESLSCGGLIHMLSGRGVRTTLLILTKGECGTPNAALDLTLKDTRSKELTQSAKVLGFSKVVLKDMGDGQLIDKKDEIKAVVSNAVSEVKPDLVITYDRSGLYGHPDHMVLSDVVTDLMRETFPNTTLWYTSHPQAVLATISLPTHMAKDPDFLSLRSVPTHRIYIGHHVVAKVRSLLCHTSQLAGFKKALPMPWMPLWFPYSSRLFEYFAEVKPSTR